MKQCANCGAKIPDAATFCPVCGETIEYPQKMRKYDNYYDDVPVIDAKVSEKKKPGSGTALKIGLVVGGLIVALSVCIAVLCLI